MDKPFVSLMYKRPGMGNGNAFVIYSVYERGGGSMRINRHAMLGTFPDIPPRYIGIMRRDPDDHKIGDVQFDKTA